MCGVYFPYPCKSFEWDEGLVGAFVVVNYVQLGEGEGGGFVSWVCW